jgi:TPR repeat protein
MTLALVSKRVRDIGLVPLPLIIGVTVLLAIDDIVLTRFTDLRFFSPFARQTPLGGLLATGSIVFLICWPGRPESGSLATRDVAMRRLAIGLTALISISSAVLLMPLNFFVPQRHALIQRALASGWPSFAAALLTPLAELSDTRALNNLGVLRARGIGTPVNFDDASRLFARAADRGSIRARLNGTMLPYGRCGLNVSQAAATAAALAPIAESDWAAASLIQDCLYFQATNKTLPDRDQRSLTAASYVRQTNDGAVLQHSGSALLDRARSTQQPVHGDSDDERRYHDAVVPLARKALELLFAAADAGEPGAYEPLGTLAMQFGDKLGDDPLAVRLRERSNWEWLEVGAEKGDWAAQCRVADARITQLRFDGIAYTRPAFDSAVASARNCIDRQEQQQGQRLYREAEWLMVVPRLPRQARPMLEIDSTKAALNGFLIFDANRKLSQNTPSDAAPRKQ